MRMGSQFGTSQLSTSIEIGSGSLWGEEPRHHRLGQGRAGNRLRHSIKMAFFAENDGDVRQPMDATSL